MERSGIIVVKGTNKIGAENGDEDVELALVDKLVERD
jgi:hypothetical protein